MKQVNDIDWTTWVPKAKATLLFVVKEGQILLIRKKRGLGAGKINGPGGHIEDGETPMACAIREVQEEIGVTPTQVSASGELYFQFIDGYSLQVWVFRAADCSGTLIETNEARPLWTPLAEIPYDEMWADDHVWLPLMLQGKSFSGRFIFDGDTMLDYQLLV